MTNTDWGNIEWYTKSGTEDLNLYNSSKLSPLEVEELDAIGKHKEKDENKAKMGHCNCWKEVIFETQAYFEVLFQLHATCFRYLKPSIFFVTNLRGYKTI